MSYTLKDICSEFNIETDIESYGNGHINDTYISQTTPAFILQRINTAVFTNPEQLMCNIVNVTRYLADKIAATGGDPKRETMQVIKCRNGKNYFEAEDGKCFRMYTYVENSITHETADTPEILENAGEAFGNFQRVLDGYPAETLFEVIKDFHVTPLRVGHLKDAIKKNASGRLENAAKQVDFALEYSKYASCVTDEIANGTVPIRVTHNDTKLNNILFDAKTDKGLCVIDLDTVMPGSALYDFGDALRFGASNAAEDEKDLSKVWFDLEKFEAFTRGFLRATKDCLTPMEIELLPKSVLLLTYECGIRFLTDYINGDTYFKVQYPEHNLDRANTQLKLVYDIESKLSDMADIVDKVLKSL